MAEPRERLELVDFESPAGDGEFDPVVWLNARLAKSNVTFERLDQHLNALGMSCQLLCQDTSESIEVASNQLVAQLPSTGRDLERMHQEALRGRERLGTVLAGLEDSDGRKRGGLQHLADADVVKGRVEAVCSALREVGSWERRIRECEQMVHAGNLPTALSQLVALQGSLDAFRMLPEFSKKEEQVKALEEDVLSTARRRARAAVERGSASDLQACCAVFSGMRRQEEPAAIAKAVFLEVAEKTWQGQNPESSPSAASLAAATKAMFDSLKQSFEDRWQLLQSLEAAAASGAEKPEGKAVESGEGAAPASSVAASAVQGALGVLASKLERCLSAAPQAVDGAGEGEETSVAHARASRAVAVLAAYVDGFASLGGCAPMASSQSLWLQVCSGSDKAEVLPWALLVEVMMFAVWHPVREEAMALVPASDGNIRPSEAVLAAESKAKRLLQMPSSWARRLEQQGAAQLAVAWLACVDEACALYWAEWDKLIEVFQNTLEQKQQSLKGQTDNCAYDVALLNECLQLHGMLHDSIPASFAAFQVETLQLAVRMSAASSPFGQALAAKMRDPEVWCERLATPSAAALKRAHAALDGAGPSSAALAARASKALPSSAAGLSGAEKKIRSVVVRCCVQPVSMVLGAYQEQPEWIKADEPGDVATMAGGMLPLQSVRAVGDHLFSLVPQLERSQDGPQLQWLPKILEAVADVMLQKVLQIKKLSLLGAHQLTADLEYLQKLAAALSSSGGGGGSATAAAAAPAAARGAAARLNEVLAALGFLVEQKKQRGEGAAALGTPPVLQAEGRQAERALRAALGLA